MGGKVAKKIKKGFQKVGKALKQTFTGKYNLGNGNDTISRLAAVLTVNDGRGHLTVKGGFGKAVIRKRGKGNIYVRGAAGVTDVEHRHDGHIDVRVAAAKNKIRHYGWYGNVYFAGAGFKNDIYSKTKGGKVTFRGAGASNKVGVESIDGRHAWVDFAGAGASNYVYSKGQTASIRFSGAGARNYIVSASKYGDIHADAAGFKNHIKLYGEWGDINFRGAGAQNTLEHHGRNGSIRFKGAGASNKLRLTGHWGDIHFDGAGASNVLIHEANYGWIYFKGAGVGNVLTMKGEDGRINFDGAGAANVLIHTAKRGDIIFKGAGGKNSLIRNGTEGAVIFRGAGASNEIKAHYSGWNTRSRIEFYGGGLGNKITLSGNTGQIHFDGAGAKNEVTHDAKYGDLNFKGGGFENKLKMRGIAGTIRFAGAGGSNKLEHTAQRGDIIFAGIGGKNKLTRRGVEGAVIFRGGGASNEINAHYSGSNQHSRVEFYGGGLSNKITLSGNTGQIHFEGGGAENSITHDADYGSITFKGGGLANILKMRGIAGDIDFVGIGAANKIEHLADYGDINFAGGGGANLINLSGIKGNINFAGVGAANILTHTANHGDIIAYGGGGANVLTRLGRTGRIIFGGVGAANILTAHFSEDDERNRVEFNGIGFGNVLTLTGARGDMVMRGAGSANILTHTADEGDVSFWGLGGANIITRTGNNGRVEFRGAGVANVVTLNAKGYSHDNEIDFIGVGVGNVVTAAGGRASIRMIGGGGANILTNTADFGDITFMGAGFANVVTRVGKSGQTRFYGVGYGNAVTSYLSSDDKSNKLEFYGAGRANLVTAAGGHTDYRFWGIGGANIATNAAKTGTTDVIALGGFNIVTSTAHGDMRAWVGGQANVVTHVGNGRNDVLALGRLNVITLVGDGASQIAAIGNFNVITKMGAGRTSLLAVGKANVIAGGDGGFDAILVGKLNVMVTGKGFDRVLAFGKYNVIVTNGTHEGTNDLVMAFGNYSIVDSGAGAKLGLGIGGSALDGLFDPDALEETLERSEETEVVLPGKDIQGDSQFMAMGLEMSEAGETGADFGMEDMSEEEKAEAMAMVQANQSMNSDDLVSQGKSRASENMNEFSSELTAAAAEEKANKDQAEAEKDEEEAAQKEQDDAALDQAADDAEAAEANSEALADESAQDAKYDGSNDPTEEQLNGAIAALAAEGEREGESAEAEEGSSQPAVDNAQDSGYLNLPAFITGLGFGLNFQHQDGAVQIYLGKMQVGFGTSGSDVILAVGRYSVMFGGAGDDWIIAGSPLAARRFLTDLKDHAMAMAKPPKGQAGGRSLDSKDVLKGFGGVALGIAQSAVYLNDIMAKADKAGDSLTKKTKKRGSGNYLDGGDGNDVLVSFSALNVMNMGKGGMDVAVALGYGNLVLKNARGNLVVVLGGMGNVVVHSNHGWSPTEHMDDKSKLYGALLGTGNFVYAHAGVDIDGLAMLGNGNFLIKTVNNGDISDSKNPAGTYGGDVSLIMGGSSNVAYVEGDGRDLVLQVGVSLGSSAKSSSNPVVNFLGSASEYLAGSIYMRRGHGNMTIGQFGKLNLAVKIGDGGVLGAAVGGRSAMVHVGNGHMTYFGVGLSQDSMNVAVKVGHGNMNVALVGLGSVLPTGGVKMTSLSSIAGTGGGTKKLKEFSKWVTGNLVQNVAFQYGNGKFNGLALGGGNIMVRVNNTEERFVDTNYTDAPGLDDSLTGRIGFDASKVGEGIGKLTGRYDTVMGAVSTGSLNVLVDVNATIADGDGGIFNASRDTARDLILRAAETEGATRKITVEELINRQLVIKGGAEDGGDIFAGPVEPLTTTDTIMVGMRTDLFGSKSKKTTGSGTTSNSPSAPDTGSLTDAQLEEAAAIRKFDGKFYASFDENPSATNPLNFSGHLSGELPETAEKSGANVLMKVGNGMFFGVGGSTQGMDAAVTRMLDDVSKTPKLEAYHKKQIEQFMFHSPSTGALSGLSRLEAMTNEVLTGKRRVPGDLVNNFKSRFQNALIDDQVAVNGDPDASGSEVYAAQNRITRFTAMVAGTPVGATVNSVDEYGKFEGTNLYVADGAAHKIYEEARSAAKKILTTEANREISKAIKSEKKAQGVSSLEPQQFNIVTHFGHGQSYMVGMDQRNLLMKVGLGHTVQVALGSTNYLVKIEDEDLSRNYVEQTDTDVQIAIGTGNTIINTGVADGVIIAGNLAGAVATFESIKSLLPKTLFKPLTGFGDAKEDDGYYKYDQYSKWEESNFRHTKRLKDFVKGLYSGKSRGKTLGKGVFGDLYPFNGRSFSKNVSNAKNSLVAILNDIKLVKQGQAAGTALLGSDMSISGVMNHMLEMATESNIIVGGSGADAIVAMGEMNIIFSDNISDVFDFDLRTLLSARQQTQTILPFRLPLGAEMNIEWKTLNGDLGALLGMTPDVDTGVVPDPEGMAASAKEFMNEYVSDSMLNNVMLPPGLSAIGGMGFEIGEWINKDLFSETQEGVDKAIEGAGHGLEANKAALNDGFSKLANTAGFVGLIDFSALLNGGSDYLKELFMQLNPPNSENGYMQGNGDVVVGLGGNNIAFTGHGSDIILMIGQMNLAALGDGHDISITLGNDNRVTADAGNDLIIGMGDSNILVGDEGDDIVVGLGSYNRVRGFHGNDLLIAAGSLNIVSGGEGDNILIGVGDKNEFYGGDGNDFVIAMGTKSYFSLGGGSDRIVNIGFGSMLAAGNGGDLIGLHGAAGIARGEGDNDYITTSQDASFNFGDGGLGHDTIEAGGSNNLFAGDNGRDVFYITDKLLEGNTVLDVSNASYGMDTGDFDPLDTVNFAKAESDNYRTSLEDHASFASFGNDADTVDALGNTDSIVLSAKLFGSTDPMDVAALLNEVQFTRDGEDLKLATRAARRTGIGGDADRMAGDVTFDGYFVAKPADDNEGTPGEFGSAEILIQSQKQRLEADELAVDISGNLNEHQQFRLQHSYQDAAGRLNLLAVERLIALQDEGSAQQNVDDDLNLAVAGYFAGDKQVQFGKAYDLVTLNQDDITVTSGADAAGIRFIGFDGSDTMSDAGTGNTTDGGLGDDSITATGSDATLIGGEGNDALFANGSKVTADGGLGDDALTATGADATLIGGEGTDMLIGEGVGTNMDGGFGDDTLVVKGEGRRFGPNLSSTYVQGGAGDDLLDIAGDHIVAIGGGGASNPGTSGFQDDANSGNDIIYLSGNKGIAKVGGGRNIVFVEGSGSYVFGGDGTNVIIGTGADNVLKGGTLSQDGQNVFALKAGGLEVTGGKGQDIFVLDAQTGINTVISDMGNDAGQARDQNQIVVDFNSLAGRDITFAETTDYLQIYNSGKNQYLRLFKQDGAGSTVQSGQVKILNAFETYASGFSAPAERFDLVYTGISDQAPSVQAGSAIADIAGGANALIDEIARLHAGAAATQVGARQRFTTTLGSGFGSLAQAG